MIVMATHGRSGVERLVMGSTAQGIVQCTDIPVLLIRPPRFSRHQSLAQMLSTIPVHTTCEDRPFVIALDGTAEAEAVLAPTIALAQQLHHPITLVHVLKAGDSDTHDPDYRAYTFNDGLLAEKHAREYLAKN